MSVAKVAKVAKVASVLFRDVEVAGRRVDVRTGDGRVREVGSLNPDAEDEVVDGRGGALVPGLHDHHVHLLALAAARASVDCRGGLEALAGHGMPGTWVRAVGATESVDRHALDRIVDDRPVRVQHRSGALWMLNSAALREVERVLSDSPDVERDDGGRPTGRLWRYDQRLRPALPSRPPDLAAVGRELTSYGVTGVTDAPPGLVDPAPFATLSQHVTLLGDRKVLLRDHDLPDFDDLAETVRRQHRRGRPVAVHCVTRESLVLTLAVLDEVGVLPGDRIEHAAVVPPGTAPWLARLGVRVVTQPGFLADRGHDYRRDVAPDDLAHLYPFASLLAAGVPTVASSDAPYGPLDPWQVIRAARDRLDPTGVVVGPEERVAAATALAGYLDDPDGRARRVVVGAPADLCLLHTGLAEALETLDKDVVRGTWFSGS